MQRPLPDDTHETDIHAPVGILTHNPSKRAAVDRTANITNITCTKIYMSDVECPDNGSCKVPEVSRRVTNVWCVYISAYNVGYID
jgi:hypothetical protein